MDWRNYTLVKYLSCSYISCFLEELCSIFAKIWATFHIYSNALVNLCPFPDSNKIELLLPNKLHFKMWGIYAVQISDL
jgi:hypothetical protein